MVREVHGQLGDRKRSTWSKTGASAPAKASRARWACAYSRAVERGAEVEDLRERGAVLAATRREGVGVGERRFGRAEREPARGHLGARRNRDGMDLRTRGAQDVAGVAEGGGRRSGEALAAVRLVEADAQAARAARQLGGVVGHRRGEARGIAGVPAGDHREDRRRVRRRARDRADVVERCGEREDAAAADSPPRRLQPGDAARVAREADRAAGVGAERTRAEARGGRDAGAARGDAGPERRAPRVHRRVHLRVVRGHRALGGLELAEEDRARRAQAGGDLCVAAGVPALVHDRAGAGRSVERRDQVLQRERHAVDGALRGPVCELVLRGARPRERGLGGHHDVRAQRRLQRLDAGQVRLGRGDRRHLARAQPRGELGEGQLGELRHRGIVSHAGRARPFLTDHSRMT